MSTQDIRLLATAVGVLARREHEMQVIQSVVGEGAVLRVTQKQGRLVLRRLPD